MLFAVNRAQAVPCVVGELGRSADDLSVFALLFWSQIKRGGNSVSLESAFLCELLPVACSDVLESSKALINGLAPHRQIEIDTLKR